MKNATGFSGDWRRITVHEVHKPELKQYEGKTIADVAQTRGKDPLDTFLDLALEDGLDIGYVLAQFNVDEKRVADNLTDPGVLIALGDGGAHVDMLCDAGYPTYLLGTWVRERQIMTLEQAVQRLTAQPADLFGIKGRGRLAVGQAADIAIFDPDDDRLGEPRRAPLRPAGRRQAHGHAVARRRIHDRQRPDRLCRWPCHRRDERNGAAVVADGPAGARLTGRRRRATNGSFVVI